MRLVLPRLYVVLDAALVTDPDSECAQKLADAGVRMLQYRNKSASSRELFLSSRRLSSQLVPLGISFLVNDRADVASVVDATGVHVGQEDLSAEAARELMGMGKWVGVSTHNLEQFERAAANFIVPLPPRRSPSHTASAVRIAMVRPFGSAEVRELYPASHFVAQT